MSEEEEEKPRNDQYVEADSGFDHPNVTLMDNQYLLTMNNELIRRGYIASPDVPIVKAEIKVMGALERLFAGGYYDVDTARAIAAGAFTLERAVEVARDGMFLRMEHSQFNYELMNPIKKEGGFLRNPFRKKEEPMYMAEPRR